MASKGGKLLPYKKNEILATVERGVTEDHRHPNVDWFHRGWTGQLIRDGFLEKAPNGNLSLTQKGLDYRAAVNSGVIS